VALRREGFDTALSLQAYLFAATGRGFGTSLSGEHLQMFELII
jgi:hypothetical protein